MREIPATMASAVYTRPGEIVIEQRPVPAPEAGQVLVEMSHCGICGSDIHMVLEGWGTPGRVEGHEWTGVVAAVGPGVTGWRPGDEVVGGPAPRCGDCRRCREGQPSQCENRGRTMKDGPALDGGFADYVLADARQLLVVPPGLGRRAAALAEPMAVALHGITRERDPHRAHGDGDGCRPHRGPVDRCARGPRARAGRRRRAGGEPPGVGDRARRRPGAPPRRARGLSASGNRTGWRRRPVDVVLECSGKEGGDGSGLLPAPPRRPVGDGGRRDRDPGVRPQPDAAQRAHRVRLVRLRRRGLRAGPRAAEHRELPARPADRSRGRTPRPARRHHDRPGQRSPGRQGDGRALPLGREPGEATLP